MDNCKGVRGSTKSDIESEFSYFKCNEYVSPHGWYQKELKETNNEFEIRVIGIVEWLWELSKSNTLEGVVIVAHGNLLSAVLNGLLSGSVEQKVNYL